MSNVVPFIRVIPNSAYPPLEEAEADGGIPYGALVAGTSGGAFSIYYIASEREFMLVSNIDDTALAFAPSALLNLHATTRELCDKAKQEGLDGFVELEDV